MDAIKIEAAVADTDEVARALWLKPVATEAVAVGAIEAEPAKGGEPVEAKPVEYEERYPADANGYRVFPVDENGRPIDWHDIAARKRGGIVHVMPEKEVTPDPASTIDKPLPPLEVKDVTKFFMVGRSEAKAALEAKLTTARAVDVAKAALVEAGPVEGEVVLAK